MNISQVVICHNCKLDDPKVGFKVIILIKVYHLKKIFSTFLILYENQIHIFWKAETDFQNFDSHNTRVLTRGGSKIIM